MLRGAKRFHGGAAAGRARALAGALALALLFLAGCGGPSLERALRLAERGEREAALVALRGYEPKEGGEWQALAALYAGTQGFEDQAIAHFTPLAERGDAAAAMLAAQVAAEQDRPGQAAEWLDAALERFPDDNELAIEYAKLLGKLERHKEAVAVLAPRAGNDPRLLNLTGYAWLLAGDAARARAFLERSISEALSRGRPYAPPHYHLGLIEAEEGELAAALEHFEAAMSANPQHLEAHYQALAAAERLGLDANAARAREGFARLYEARLDAQGALGERPGEGEPVEVDRSASWESRERVEEPRFVRSYPAGATLELACLAPRGARARFIVESAAGASLMDVVHEGGPADALWVPHELALPAGEGELELRFSIEPAGGLAGFFGGESPEGAAFSEPRVLGDPGRRSADPRPNILLVSLDTMRGDRLGADGYERATTPALDALAARGARFTSAQAPSNWTLPSHYSMLSGLTPIAHGVLPDLRDVRAYLRPDQQLNVRGSGLEKMIAEVLEEAGYRTAAVTEDGWVSGHFGFDQGFDVYRSAPAGSLPGTLAGALAELETAGERGPWFLFVHTYAPHQPDHAPPPFRLRFADADHRGFAWPEARVPIEDYYRFRMPWFAVAPSDVEAFHDVYDGQVAWSDTLVEELVRWLGERGLMEQSVIVVTSDHGEEIFERGQFDHGDTLHEEVTRVPLVVHAPGRVTPGRVVEGPVSLIDLPATLMDLAGLGDTLGQGRSLLPLLEGEGESARSERVAFAQAIGRDSEPLFAAWSGRYKYLRRESEEGVVEECFDLLSDPEERVDIAEDPRCPLSQLRELAAAHESESGEIREALGAGEGEIDRETLERLRSLGYAR